MSFIWPVLLYLLLFVPLLFWLYARMQQRKKVFAARYGSLGIVNNAAGNRPGVRRHVPAFLFLGGIATLIFSLARPQATINVPKLEGTVILTFDVSGSMSAEDVQPNRMEVAKAAALDFVDKQPANVTIGVVAFSDGGLSVQPPTRERGETIATIERLVPRRGTSLGNGILVSLNAIAVDAGDPSFLNPNDLSSPETPASPPQGWYPSAVIVLFSDGENNAQPDPAVVADLAVDLGVRIYTVGVGTPAGADIQAEGFTIHSQLDEPMLQYIAVTTGGAYYHAGNEEEVNRIYRDLQPRLSIKPEDLELTSIFAGIGMLVFLIGGMLSLFWFGHVP